MALFIRSKKYIKYTNYQIFTRNTYCFITLSCRNTVIPVDWLLTNKIKKYFFLRLMRHCLQQWTTVIIFLHFLISNISEIFFSSYWWENYDIMTIKFSTTLKINTLTLNITGTFVMSHISAYISIVSVKVKCNFWLINWK